MGFKSLWNAYINIYVNAMAALLYLSINLISKTLRIEIKGRESFDKIKKSGGNVLFAVWHRSTFPLFHLYRNTGAYVLVDSQVRGKILSRCARWLGFNTIPISIKNNIVSANTAARVIKYLKNGHDVVIAVDGPEGPAFEVKPGTLFLSKRTKIPVIALGVKYFAKISLFWRWDKYNIPLPFSGIVVSLSRPITPEEAANIDLKQVLNALSGNQST